MKCEFDTDKIVDNVVSEALEREIDGKTIKQWMTEIAKHKWISVKDRLPEERVWVLCLCRSGIREVLRWQNEQWLHDLSPFAYMKSFVTHWMPLPEPPKEGKDDNNPA